MLCLAVYQGWNTETGFDIYGPCVCVEFVACLHVSVMTPARDDTVRSELSVLDRHAALRAVPRGARARPAADVATLCSVAFALAPMDGEHWPG